ncbi:DUF3617 domain-containing protein [Sphingopyxis sp.]|uniref:DUF3617 domain-containing protein n=1 Tax=Sphingopyxis sp. TaxID=1908224 RepID=UPI002EDAD6BE
MAGNRHAFFLRDKLIGFPPLVNAQSAAALVSVAKGVLFFAWLNQAGGRLNSRFVHMRKAKKLPQILALIVLAAAGGTPGGSVAREAGNWKNDRKLVKFEFPGMPAKERDRVVGMMSNNPSINECLTQEQIDKEGPLVDLLARKGAGEAQCTWSKKAIVDGKVDIVGACVFGDQAFDLAVTGTAASDKTDILVAIDGKVPLGKVEMSVIDVRTGPCVAGEAKKS